MLNRGTKISVRCHTHTHDVYISMLLAANDVECQKGSVPEHMLFVDMAGLHCIHHCCLFLALLLCFTSCCTPAANHV